MFWVFFVFIFIYLVFLFVSLIICMSVCLSDCLSVKIIMIQYQINLLGIDVINEHMSNSNLQQWLILCIFNFELDKLDVQYFNQGLLVDFSLNNIAATNYWCTPKTAQHYTQYRNNFFRYEWGCQVDAK